MNVPMTVSIILSIGLVVAGYVLTMLNVLETNWVARAGSLVVLVGVVSGLGGYVSEAVLRDRLLVRQKVTEMRIRRFYRRDPEARERALEDLAEQFQPRLAGLKDRARVSFGFLEVLLVGIGTLLWGFGDLIPVP